MRWAGNVACEGEINSAYRVVLGIYKQKRLLARSRRGWDDNIKMDIKRNCMGRHGLDSSGCGFLWRQNNPEVNYAPTRIFGGGSVSGGSITL
jgi:hypothetical protein